MKHYFQIILLFILLPGICQNNLLALSGDSLGYEFRHATHDTARVKILFQSGNRFIDGPSDSLLFYYHRALHIIEKNIQILYIEKNTDTHKLFHVFQALQLRAFIELGIEYFFRSDYNQALQYYFAAADVATQTGDVSHLSECYGEIGIVYKNQGKLNLALEYHQKALEIALTLNEPDWVAICNNNLGNIYKAKGFYSLAIDYYLRALQTFVEMNQPRRVASCMHSIGTLFFEQKNHPKALDYYNRALEIALQTGDRIREVNLKMALGNTLADIGQTTAAKTNYFEALHIFDSTGYRHGLDDCYKLLGLAYLDEQNQDSATIYFNKALQISSRENDQTNMAEIFGKQGIVFLRQRKYDMARKAFQESETLATKLGAPALVMDACNNLYQLHKSLQNPDKALAYYVRYANMKDSLFKVAQYHAITEMEIKYETTKNEQDIALLTQKTQLQLLTISRRNRLLWFIGAAFILMIAGGYFIFQNKRLRAGQKATELENRLLRAQMNPHFIFNSLIAIQGFIYERNPVEAGDFLAKFADLIRLTLENSRTEFVGLDKEIGMLKVYLELQQLRFEGKFDFNIETDENLDTENIKIPPMLAQPFIENAVEHGIRHKTEKGLIRIVFRKEKKIIVVTVQDDGIGREAAMKLRPGDKPQSLAISITRDRLKVLSKKYRRKFDFRITDLCQNQNQPCGTKVEFSMPLEEG